MKIRNDILGMCATNTYYICNEDTKEMIIIDPADNAGHIISTVDNSGYKPVAILVTHGHFDHILVLPKVREKYGIKAYIGKNEERVLHSPDMNLTDAFMGEPFTLDADVYLKDGEELSLAGFKIKAFETPGHTPGGMCFYFEEDKVLISGDTLFNSSVGRTDFPGGNMSAIVRSIREKLFVLPEDVKVYPGHGEATTIGYEKVYNPFCS